MHTPPSHQRRRFFLNPVCTLGRRGAGALLAAAMLTLGTLGAPAQADDVHVAVAANFLATLQALATDFQARTGHHLVISSGSTGKLYAQIKNGAPYDVLLAADTERPQRLEQEGLAVAGSRYTYAVGRLALWSRDPGRIDAQGKVLTSGSLRHLAIANPQTAPYGVAARQALEHLGVWERYAPDLVRGEDIGQVLQFVDSGNADAGLVALAQVVKHGGGSYWRVPATYHAALAQQAVLLRRAEKPAAARAFLDYLRGSEARAILQRDGYGLP
jgi:molybdate transport system substrate-binding protein